jgi:hypothetical protein
MMFFLLSLAVSSGQQCETCDVSNLKHPIGFEAVFGRNKKV